MLKIVKSRSLKNDPLAGMSPQVFLKQYWQRKPVLFRSAISDFSSLMSDEEFFELASSGRVNTRCVSHNKAPNSVRPPWLLRSGPLPKSWKKRQSGTDWTVLVQDVEKVVPKTLELVEKFDFIPDWRRDDLMVSYAVPGGTVGPHVDRYDVFLVQMKGVREWRLGPANPSDLIPNLPLKVLANFKTSVKVICNPGDVLYLPPGLGHYGIAKTECMTYSVGFRAPSSTSLVDAIFAAVPGEGPLYSDAGLKLRKNQGELLPADFLRIGNLFSGLTTQRPVRESILDLITGHSREIQNETLQVPPESSRVKIKTWWRNPSCRVAFTEFHSDGVLYFSADGHGETVHDRASAQLCRVICGQTSYSSTTLQKLATNKAAKLFLANLIKQGLLIPAR